MTDDSIFTEDGALFQCLECGEVFKDRYATGIRTLAPAECPRCGEEVQIALAGQASADGGSAS